MCGQPPSVVRSSAARPSLFYNAGVKTWDVIIVGGGIIGLSLSIALRKRGAAVLVVERGEPGREASHAAGGMLVDCPLETPAALQPLATASAKMYPEFAHELEVESGMKVDLRDQGTILFPSLDPAIPIGMTFAALARPRGSTRTEPALTRPAGPAFILRERSVDPRALTAAAWKTAKIRGVDFSSGDEVTAVNCPTAAVVRRHDDQNQLFSRPKVVNCAGAWSGQMELNSGPTTPPALPTRPVKGQMLCLASARA